MKQCLHQKKKNQLVSTKRAAGSVYQFAMLFVSGREVCVLLWPCVASEAKGRERKERRHLQQLSKDL
jgi:hypothetical protein